MRSYEKDYRYLLLNLVPQRRLSTGLRRGIASALGAGNPQELRHQSVLALEELCESDYLVRTGLRSINNEIVADYKKKGGRYHLSVAVPAAEWEKFVGPEPYAPAAPTAQPTAESEPGAPTVPSPVNGRLVDLIPEIVRTFSVPDQANPVFDRLEQLLDTIKQWLGFIGIRLYLLEDVVNISDVSGELITVVSLDELRYNEFFRECIESGVYSFVPRSGVVGTAAGGEPDGWEYAAISPVFGLGKVSGILKIFFGPGMDERARTTRLETATNLIKQAIEFNTQIENITSVDPLTRVYNRHFYDTQVAVEIERATRSGNEVSMLVIDLDDFKQINDSMGHKKGDEALGAAAELIRRNLRKVDLPFRYGGEEFVILLPGTSEFESVHTAERLRRVIAEYDGFKDLHGLTKRITVSIGVSVFPDRATSADDLFNQADTAMFRAKQTGKNRVVLYKSDMDMDGG